MSSSSSSSGKFSVFRVCFCCFVVLFGKGFLKGLFFGKGFFLDAWPQDFFGDLREVVMVVFCFFFG